MRPSGGYFCFRVLSSITQFTPKILQVLNPWEIHHLRYRLGCIQNRGISRQYLEFVTNITKLNRTGLADSKSRQTRIPLIPELVESAWNVYKVREQEKYSRLTKHSPSICLSKQVVLQNTSKLSNKTLQIYLNVGPYSPLLAAPVLGFGRP